MPKRSWVRLNTNLSHAGCAHRRRCSAPLLLAAVSRLLRLGVSHCSHGQPRRWFNLNIAITKTLEKFKSDFQKKIDESWSNFGVGRLLVVGDVNKTFKVVAAGHACGQYGQGQRQWCRVFSVSTWSSRLYLWDYWLWHRSAIKLQVWASGRGHGFEEPKLWFLISFLSFFFLFFHFNSYKI